MIHRVKSAAWLFAAVLSLEYSVFRGTAGNRHTGIKIQACAAAYKSVERMVVPALSPEIDTRSKRTRDEREQHKARVLPVFPRDSTDANRWLETTLDAWRDGE